jgi:hypothetical protein
MNTPEVLERVLQIVELYKSGALGGEIMSEDALLGVVSEGELPNIITLGMALNYQRNSPYTSRAQWRSHIEMIRRSGYSIRRRLWQLRMTVCAKLLLSTRWACSRTGTRKFGVQ